MRKKYIIRGIAIAMVKDVNGRLPFASEYSSDGSNKPGETAEQYEVRMCYHEGVLRPNYPVPAIIREYELGWSLSESKPVWIVSEAGVYDG